MSVNYGLVFWLREEVMIFQAIYGFHNLHQIHRELFESFMDTQTDFEFMVISAGEGWLTIMRHLYYAKF